jgi:hypothetical protein
MPGWVVGLLVLLGAASAPEAAGRALPAWRSLEPGLDLGAFPATRAVSPSEDAFIRIVRIDPERYSLVLLNASARGEGRTRTARGWAVQHGLSAAINASMYQIDLRRSVSLMRSREHVNNPRLSKDKAVLAFDPIEAGVPAVQIIDRECQDFEALSGRYGTLVQNIRMVSCSGRNVWAQQPRAWSTAAIGMDRQGRVLFIHARAAHTTHDLIESLLELPIDLRNAMYTEGGPEAQLYVRGGGQEMEFTGTIEGADTGSPMLAWPVPNVIGVRPRGASPGRP